MSTTHSDRIDLSPQAVREMFPVETAMLDDDTVRAATERVLGDPYIWKQVRAFLSDAIEIEAQRAAGINVVAAYTDTHALIDGMLYDISREGLVAKHGQQKPIDRVTATLYQLEDWRVHVDYAAMEATGPAEEDGYLLATEGSAFGRIWLCINERGNYTAMRPEDY